MTALDLFPHLSRYDYPDGQQLATAQAEKVRDLLHQALQQRGQALLLVSGGRSPIPFFKALSALPLDWAHVTVSLVDERCVTPKQAGSNEQLVRDNLLQGAAAQADFISLYPSTVHDLQQAVSRAEAALQRLHQTPADVAVLGMGEDGHTASLFPGNPGLAAALAEDNPQLCVPMQAPVPPHARISLTFAALAQARTRLLAIQGPAKLATLQQAAHSTPLEKPIRAFLERPLMLYVCP